MPREEAVSQGSFRIIRVPVAAGGTTIFQKTQSFPEGQGSRHDSQWAALRATSSVHDSCLVTGCDLRGICSPGSAERLVDRDRPD
jgi:hypothetical protein